MNAMLTVTAALVFVTTGALAQQVGMPAQLVPVSQPATPERTQPAAATAAAAPLTWNQARAKIEAQGYSDVRGLAQDGSGTWRAKAMKDGKPVAVSVAATGAVLVR